MRIGRVGGCRDDEVEYIKGEVGRPRAERIKGRQGRGRGGVELDFIQIGIDEWGTLDSCVHVVELSVSPRT